MITAVLLVSIISSVNASAANVAAPAGAEQVTVASTGAPFTATAIRNLRAARASLVANATDEVALDLMNSAALPGERRLTKAEAGELLREGTAATVDNMITRLEADAALGPVDDVNEFVNDSGPDESGSEEDAATALGTCRHKRYIKYSGWRFLPLYTSIWYIGAFYSCSKDVRICGAGGAATAAQKWFFSAGIGLDGADGCPLIPIMKAKGGTKPNLLGGAEIAVFTDGTFDWDYFIKLK